MNNTELHNVLAEMIDHVGTDGVLDELTRAMSTDELEEHVSHLDQYLFDNHFLTLES